jgi:hypothetical protein
VGGRREHPGHGGKSGGIYQSCAAVKRTDPFNKLCLSVLL